VSRAQKPLFNLPPWKPGKPRDCEVFVNNFRDTIKAVRTRSLKANTPSIQTRHIYGLELLDHRLHLGSITNPTPEHIYAQLRRANQLGHEGLVLRQNDRWIKVKPSEGYDVAISGFVEGRGKHHGRLGHVKTAMGGVGSGFSDAERESLWTEALAGRLIGQVIEVSCLQITADGMFRHPVFVRLRPDKLAA
jgi:ATP-dependent DNA ligase